MVVGSHGDGERGRRRKQERRRKKRKRVKGMLGNELVA
jgi:hypothetical protein